MKLWKCFAAGMIPFLTQQFEIQLSVIHNHALIIRQVFVTGTEKLAALVLLMTCQVVTISTDIYLIMGGIMTTH